MNYYNSEALLEQQQEIEKLKEQNAALAAQNEALRDALDKIANWNECTSEFRVNFGSNGERDFYRAVAAKAIELTPQHRLRQVRADAVKAFTDDAITTIGEYQDVQVSSGRDTDAVDIEIIHAIESSKLRDYANQHHASILAGKE